MSWTKSRRKTIYPEFQDLDYDVTATDVQQIRGSYGFGGDSVSRPGSGARERRVARRMSQRIPLHAIQMQNIVQEREEKELLAKMNGHRASQKIPDEIDRDDQLEAIKQSPVKMGIKRQMWKKVLEDVPQYKPSGFKAIWLNYWNNQKMAHYRIHRHAVHAWQETNSRITLWRGAFKAIEGHFGSGVLTYFRFLKWLWQLNLAIFFLIFIFIIVPMLSFPSLDYHSAFVAGSDLEESEVTEGVNVTLALYCSSLYTVTSNATDHLQIILDFFLGTGWMEQTLMFQGAYADRELVITGLFSYHYNMPLAYLITSATYFLISLIFIVRKTAKGFRESTLSSRSEFTQKYCNRVLGSGWDYTVSSPKNASLIQKSVCRQIAESIAEDRLLRKRENLSQREKCRVWWIRIACNLLVVLLLAGAAYLIYFVVLKNIEITTSKNYLTYDLVLQFVIQYMPSLVIAVLNGILPVLFKLIVKLEDYTPAVAVNITLVRTVFLKFASLAVLVFTIYSRVTCTPRDVCNVSSTDECPVIRCWETSVGQELYKLVMLETFKIIGLVLLYEFPRKLIVSRCSCKVAKVVGFMDFDIPKHVLDLIYAQTLMWLGCFFSPIISVLCVIQFFIFFYVRMLTTMFNYKPSLKPYKASDSNNIFLMVLLLAYVLCTVPIIYVVYALEPSKGCGPFRIYRNMFDIIPITMQSWPSAVNSFMEFLASSAFLIPAFIILILVIYYLSSNVSTFKEMIRLLREQIKSEGHDKNRLAEQLRKATSTAPEKRVKLSTPKQKPQTPSQIPEHEPLSSPPPFTYQRDPTSDVTVAIPTPVPERPGTRESATSLPPIWDI